MTSAEFLQRAFAAREVPTLYMLGKGGWVRAEAGSSGARAQPGRPIDVGQELDKMRRERPTIHAAYVQGLEKSGLSMASLPKVACDCSGFVTWALGLARDGAPWAGGWFDTNAIHADAQGPQQFFKRVGHATPGVLVVYPKPISRGPEGPPGHIGIVTEVDADGSATRVLHCAPENYVLPPPNGLRHNAIAETGPEQFQADPRSRYVVWIGLAA